MEKDKKDPIYDSLVLELRRGTIVLSILSQLKSPQYGYSLITLLEEKGTNIDAGTLYPLLRRLEKQELLESSWDTESSKPRKYYVLSEYGKIVYEKLCSQWTEMVEKINMLMDEQGRS